MDSFWFRHYRLPPSKRIRLAQKPTPNSLAAIRGVMSELENRAVAAGSLRVRFPFGAGNVQEVRRDRKDGYWFILKNGQIYNQDAEPHAELPEDVD